MDTQYILESTISTAHYYYARRYYKAILTLHIHDHYMRARRAGADKTIVCQHKLPARGFNNQVIAMQTAQNENKISTRILTATKALENSFIAWSQKRTDESDVSDKYVQLGNAYMDARVVLTRANIRCDDLIDVPKQLRQILEEALAKPPSNEVMRLYGDRMRGVMAQLFRELKEKDPVRTHSRQKSANSSTLNTPVSQQYPQQYPQQYAQPYAQSSPYNPGAHTHRQPGQQYPAQPNYPQPPQAVQTPPAMANHTYQTHPDTPASPTGRHRQQQRVNPRYIEQITNPEPVQHARKRPPVNAPKSPPAQQLLAPPENDALYKLQHHGALERQASKRYSTQQLSKIVNGSPTPSVYIPTTVINRRSGVPDFRDSNVVVRRPHDTSSDKSSERRRRVHSETGKESKPEQTSTPRASEVPRTAETVQTEVKLDEVKLDEVKLDEVKPAEAVEAMEAAPELPVKSEPESNQPEPGKPARPPPAPPLPSINVESSATESSDVPSSPIKDEDVYSIEPAEETMPVFLRIGGMVRKAFVSKSPSMAALRLSFVEVCEYVHSESGIFPAIEIQDPQLHIDYELTEQTVSDVKEGQLLTLKVRSPEVLAVDEELKQVKELVKHLSDKLDGKFSSVSIPSTPNPNRIHSPMIPGPGLVSVNSFRQEKKLIDLPKDKAELVKRELAVIRQTANRSVSQMKQEVQKLRKELEYLSDAPPVGDRKFIVEAKSKMDLDVKELVSKIDDLSDVIDAQRISVGSRGVRYPKREMEKVKKELDACYAEFVRSKRYLTNGKPVWKKIWQQELNTVVDEQNWLKATNAVYDDFESDLKQTMDTFQLVCEANELPRPLNKGALVSAPPIKPGEQIAATNAMLEEISALNLDSGRRTEAVERAERVRKAKLALKSEEFVDELGAFVSDSKLKPNGGFEEVERKREERYKIAMIKAEESEIEGAKLTEALKQERKAQRAKQRAESQRSEPKSEPKSEPNETKESETRENETKENETKENENASEEKESVNNESEINENEDKTSEDKASEDKETAEKPPDTST